MESSSSEKSIFDYIDDFKTSYAVHRFIISGVYAVLDRKGPASLEELAEALSVASGEIASFINVLAAQGVVRKRDGLYSLSASIAKSTHASASDLECWSAWSAYQFSAYGASLAHLHSLSNDHRINSWMAALEVRSKLIPWSVGSIRQLLSHNSIRSILEIGPGSGSFSRRLSKTFPNACLALIDQPHVISITTEKLKDLANVSFISGDAFSSEIAGCYDLIASFNTIHLFEIDDITRLGHKVHSLLAANGRVLLGGFFQDHDLESAKLAQTMWVQKKVLPRTKKQVVTALKQAGFKLDTELAAPSHSFTYLVFRP